jgi:hypothetical protein
MSHWGKLSRAHEHFEEIRFTVDRFLKMKPYRLVRDYRPQPPFNVGSEIECVIRVNAPVEPPASLPALIGDCLTNLRASLDHLVYDIADKHTGGNLASIEKIQFPIYRDLARFKSSFEGRCKGDLPSDVITLIEGLQPYNGCNDPNLLDRHLAARPLWLLSQLVNADKHRTFVTVPQVYVEGGSRLRLNRAERVMTPLGGTSLRIVTGSFKHDAEIGMVRFVATDPKAEVTMDPEPTMAVAFGEEWPARGRHVVSTLQSISDYIRIEVFPTLEPFL